MSEYTIFWLNGQKTDCRGKDERDAFTNAGYGNGSLRAVDFMCLKESSSDYFWDNEKKRWKRISTDK